MQNQTFRLFVSSPFSDFKKERDVLHKKVFPKIDKYCNENGFSFQPVDLRWGVSSEAQLDQKTLEVCLEEVRACKHFPHPNFLIMAGDRYGYIPLPYMIEKAEFDKIKEIYENDKEKISINYKAIKNKNDEILSQKIPKSLTKVELLDEWYKLDENQIPISYILKPRKDEYKEYPNWQIDQEYLRTILQNAANILFENKENKEYLKYFTSATEAEVLEGILEYKGITQTQEKLLENKIVENSKIDKEYVYGYIRTIQNPIDKYIDSMKDKEKEGFLKQKAIDFKTNLSNTLDKDKNILTSAYDSIELYEENQLKEFEEFIYEKLINAIETQKNISDEISSIDKEILEQEKFKEDKQKGFIGRENTLNKIKDYVLNDKTNEPLVIYGISGMGKSSLIAKAIDNVSKLIPKNSLIYRFVGATQNSTTIRSLLISICDELANKNIIEKIEKYEFEEYKFFKQINKTLSSIEESIVLFIDALDQLQFKDSLEWLPENLPENFKIILSVLNDEKYEKDSHYYNFLKNKVDSNNLIDISKDSLESSKELLIENLLFDLDRKIDDYQTNYLLNKWKETNYSPLYLKIAIEEVKHWKSGDKTQKVESSVEGIVKEYIKNLSKIYHHEEIFVNKVFGYIHASNDGLSEKELLEILSEDLEDEILMQNKIINKHHEPIKVKNLRRENKEELILPMSIWSRLHTQIKPFIIQRNIDNQPLMKFFHRQFTTVIDSLIEVNKIQLHTKLSKYFYTLQDKSKTWNKRYHNLHMLSEYPYQLFYSKQSKELKEILFDLEFAGSVYDNNKQEIFRDVISKATSLISEEKIYPWESFYREKEHLILKVDEELWRPHQTLFQLAYEDAEDSPLTREAVSININWLNYFSSRRVGSYKQNRTGLESYINLNKYNIPIQNISNIKFDNSLINIRVDKKKYFFDLKGTFKKIESSADEHFEKNDKVYYHYNEENSILNIHYDNNIYQQEVSLSGYRIFEFSRNKILLVTELNIQLLSYTSNGFKKIGTFLSLLGNRTFFTNLGEKREPFEFYELENETIIGYHSKGHFIIQYIKNKHGTYEMYLHSGVHEGNSINGLVPLFEDYYLTYSHPDGILSSGRFNESSPNTDILIWKNKNILGIFSAHAGVIKRIIKDKSKDNIIRLLTMSEDKSIKLLELGAEFTSFTPLNISFENKEKFFYYDYNEFNYDNLTNILKEKNSWNLPNINIKEIYFLNDKYIASLMNSNELFIFNSFVESIKEVKLSKIKEIDNEFYLFYGKNLKKLDTQINICTTRGYLTDIMRLTKDYLVASDSQGNLTLLKNGEKVFSKKVQKGFIPEIKYFSNSSNYFVTYSTMKHEVLFEDIEVKLWNSLNFINGYENPIILKINKKILRVDCLNYELKEYLLVSTLDEIILYEFINSSIREIKKFSKSYINLFLLKNNKIVLSSSSSNIKKINNLKIVDLNCLENNLEINNIRLVQFQELNNDYFLGLCDNGALHLWNDNAEYIKSIKNRNIIYIFETSSLFAIDNRNRIIKYNNDLEEMSSSFFISENQFMNATYYSNKNWLLNFGTKILNIELDSKTVTENKRYWINNDLDNYDELSEDEKKIKKVNQIYISESRLSHEELQTYDKLDLFIKKEIIDFDEIFGINISTEELDNSNIELILKSITLEDYDRILSEENEFYDKNLGFSIYILEQFLE